MARGKGGVRSLALTPRARAVGRELEALDDQVRGGERGEREPDRRGAGHRVEHGDPEQDRGEEVAAPEIRGRLHHPVPRGGAPVLDRALHRAVEPLDRLEQRERQQQRRHRLHSTTSTPDAGTQPVMSRPALTRTRAPSRSRTRTTCPGVSSRAERQRRAHDGLGAPLRAPRLDRAHDPARHGEQP